LAKSHSTTFSLTRFIDWLSLTQLLSD